MNHQVNVPDWLYQAAHFVGRNWQAIVGILLIAALASLVTEVVKHKWTINKETGQAKKIVRWSLVAVSTAFTVLGYFVFFVQSNESVLRQLPVIGQSEVEVLGAAWTLYNFRLNKTFAIWRDRLSKWSGNKTTDSSQSLPLQQPSSDTVASDQLL